MRNQRWVKGVVWAVVSLSMIAPSLAEEEQPLAKALRELEPYVLLDGLDEDAGRERRRELSRSLYECAKALRRAANEADVAAWRRLDDREGWERLRDERLSKLEHALGQFPEPSADLQLRVLKSIPGDGFEIRNVLFESRPGLQVTANLYVPKPLRDSMPGILICHSHHRPKTQGELQDMGMTWGRAGCCVLVMDQLGHGERRSHPFASSRDFDGEFRPSRQDYYFRYVTGMQLHLLGDSLMGWMVWDLMRGVDLLCDMPGVDEERLILLGAVAGGGDPAGVTAALDERIDAVVPFNFGGPQPETVFPLPKDAEAAFNYFGGGSWESTRNLTLSISDGFPHWLIVGSVAPRRLIHAHEFAWDREHDPVWKRYQRIYGDFYEEPTHLSSAKGRGSVRGRPPESTHCTNIGPVHRSQIHPAFAKWFDIDAEEYRNRLDESELHVLRGTDEQITPPHEAFADVAEGYLDQFRRRYPANDAQRRNAIVVSWAGTLHTREVYARRYEDHVDRTVVERRTTKFGQIEIDRIALSYEAPVEFGDAPLSVLRLTPRSPKAKRPTIVWLVRAGLEDLLDQRADAIAAQLEAGFSVVLFEPAGIGLTSPGTDRGRRSNATGVSSLLLMLNRPLLGLQYRDLRTLLKWLRSQREHDGRFVLWADSLAAVNGKVHPAAVPRGIDHSPHVAEPMGHVLALLAGFLNKDIAAIVSARGGLLSFRSVLETPFVHLPHDLVVQGALFTGDLDMLAASFAPRPIRLSGRVDASNRLVEPVTPPAELVEWLEEHVKPSR